MKKLLCLFLIAGFLSANGQDNDLIVKTDLDSIRCSIRTVVGIGSVNGEIKYTLSEDPQQTLKIQKRDVFYILNDLYATEKMKYNPRFFNTNFDYTKSYFLKTGRAPKPDDPLQTKVVGNEKQEKQPQEWRYRAGKKLNTAGGLLLGSVALSVIGSLILTRADVGHNAGYVLLGAGGVSMIAGYGFLIGAGKTMQGR